MRFVYLPLLAASLVLVELGFARPAGAGELSKLVNVQLANETIPLQSRANTVGALMRELSIDLPDGAAIDPAIDAALLDGMNVNLQDITVARGATERVIPAEVEFTEQYRFGPEECVMADPGQEGLVLTSCTIFYAHGVEVGRRQSERVVRPMRPTKMICFKSLSSELDGPSAEEIMAARAKPGPWHTPPQRYKKAITMNSSAYEPGPRSCGPNATGRTSCGLKAGYGVVAVDPKFIPYGTRLFIEGYGYAVAGDTGGAIDGYDVDLGFLTVDECMQWGRKKVKAYILY